MQSDRSGVSRLVIRVAIVVIIIVLIAVIIATYPSLLSGSGGGGGGSGDWRSGYYAEWNDDYDGGHYFASGYNWTERWTVTSVNETTVTINITTLEAWKVGPAGAPVYAYMGIHLVKNMSSLLTFDIAHLPSYQTAVYVGNETISTKWGPISCEHYNVTNSLTVTWWAQYYTWNGVVIKAIHPDRTIFLTDGNVPWFPSP